MKSYTDIEQSKKLAEILSLENADMIWVLANPDLPMIKVIAYKDSEKSKYYETLPCWSLAALLDVLPKYELYNFGDTIQLDVNREALATEGDETLLDLVVNMIIHLYEIKVL